jgi:hypothetical protein
MSKSIQLAHADLVSLIIFGTRRAADRACRNPREPAVHLSKQFLLLLALRLIAPEPPETHLIASTREGRTAEVSKCHAAGHLVAVNSVIEFERQRHRVGNRYLPR